MPLDTDAMVARFGGPLPHTGTPAADVMATLARDVVFMQVCVAFGGDARTQAVTAAVLAGGETWMSGSRWHDRAVLRVSVSNAATTAADVERAVAAVARAVAEVG